MILVANFLANTKFCKKLKLTESQSHGYVSESALWELSNEHQHDRVQMVFKNRCVFVLWTKVASALEGLRYILVFMNEDGLTKLKMISVYWQIFARRCFAFFSRWESWACGRFELCGSAYLCHTDSCEGPQGGQECLHGPCKFCGTRRWEKYQFIHAWSSLGRVRLSQRPGGICP